MQSLTHRAAAASLGVALLLAFVKAGAGLATGSLALLASLIDSLADVVASAITFVSVRISRRPPDHSHRFGHGKAEGLSALAQGGLVAGSAVLVVIDSVGRFVRPEPVERPLVGILAMALAIVVTLGLVAYQRRVVARTGSLAIAADSLHYRADLLTNLAVGLSLFLAWGPGWDWADPLVAAVVACWLALHAYGIARHAVDQLMDREAPAERRAEIEGIVAAHPEVAGVHDLRTRMAGCRIFIEMHVELPRQMSVQDAHAVTERIEAELMTAFRDAEVMIHQEPEGIEDVRLDHRIEGQGA
ncbi:MAG: cation diffusion facilitator family transporter [Geminicoccaceae bacterium]|nr:cation diffusion facilitator family transporter [Geminicoccaceae bacterium]